MTYLDHLHGPVLLAALCLVIFVEECGVPVPLAPGDLLLATCGLAIRTQGLDPLLVVAAVYLCTVAGAMTGREVFDLAGVRLLRPLTASLRPLGAWAPATRLGGGLDRVA